MNDQKINRRSLFKASALALLGISAVKHTTGAVTPVDVTPNINGRFIKMTDGAELFFKDWGSGQTILFIHSWGVNSDIWQYQMNELAEQGYRCIGYDRRGHGRSSQPWTGYDYDSLAADLNQIIETLKLDKITLVSHSMAGGEIIRYLTKFGARRVAKIILTASILPYALKTDDNPNGADRTLLERSLIALKGDVQATLRAGVAGFFGTNPPVSKDLIDWGINLFSQTSLRALLECGRVNIETDFRAEMKNINVPALLIHGSADISAPIDLTAERSVTLLPNAKLKIYSDAPHGILLTHKKEVADDIRVFIKI